MKALAGDNAYLYVAQKRLLSSADQAVVEGTGTGHPGIYAFYLISWQVKVNEDSLSGGFECQVG